VCLRKDPKQRFGDIRDVRLALEGAFETAAPQTPASSTSTAASARIAWITATIAGLLAAAFAIPTMRYLRETPAATPPQMRVDINTPAMPLAFVLSPDGQYIAFVASGDGPQRLWLRLLDKTDAQPLPGTDGADYPFWSPDSRSIGFFAAGKIRRASRRRAAAGHRPRSTAAPRGTPTGRSSLLRRLGVHCRFRGAARRWRLPGSIPHARLLIDGRIFCPTDAIFFSR
jgi:hypothetical protein